MEIYPFIDARLNIELSWKIIGYLSYEFKSSFPRQPVGDPVVWGKLGVQHDLPSWLSPVMSSHCLIRKGLSAHNANFDSKLRPRVLKVRISDIFTVRLGIVIPAASVLHFSKPETSSSAFCPKWLLLHSVNVTTFDSTHTDPLDGLTATRPFVLSTTFLSYSGC